MLYGRSYSGVPRLCQNCEGCTSAHYRCDCCEKAICEHCDDGTIESGSMERHYCITECRQADCAHEDCTFELHEDCTFELIDDVDEDAGYARRCAICTCNTCGATLGDDGEAVNRRRSRKTQRRVA
jgi:hypothetical protein